MKIAWVHYFHPKMVTDGSHAGVARGYLLSGYYLWSGLKANAEVQDVAPGIAGHPKVHFHYCAPHLFRPIPGKVNVLFTMWETEELPNEALWASQHAAMTVVPSTFCASVWRAHGFEARVVPLGVAQEFLDCDPSRPVLVGRPPLRFLWVGAPTKRKGWGILAAAWRAAFPFTSVAPRLTIKTIKDPQRVEEHFGGSIRIDTRDLDPDAMLALYREHDVYVCTSHGEGFGLTALEAMASGCVAIAPAFTGLRDFVSAETAVVLPQRAEETFEYGGRRVIAPVALASDLSFFMRAVARDWGIRELEAVRLAGTARARTFTWGRSVTELLAALSDAAAMDRGRHAAPTNGNARALHLVP